MRISDWSSDVCSSDLKAGLPFENELREKIRSHITRFGKFEGLKGRSYQEAALVDLQEALGWNSYYIDEWPVQKARSEEHTSALMSLMRISYDALCLK